MPIEMTAQQKDAIKIRFELDPDGCTFLDEMEDRALPMVGSDPGIMLPYRGIWLGIEPDGYTHS